MLVITTWLAIVLAFSVALGTHGFWLGVYTGIASWWAISINGTGGGIR